MNRTAAVTAALAVACVVVGCGATVDGQAVAGVTPKAATVPLTEAPAAVAVDRWMDVTHTPVRRDETPERTQFGARPYPGVYVGQEQPDGGLNDGTLGAMIKRPRTGQTGFLTAGHLDKNPGGVVYSFADEAAKQHVELGVLSDVENDETAVDSAALWLTTIPAATNATSIAGFPVDRVMSEVEVRKLANGTPICVNGAFSGVVCAPLVGQSETISYRHLTQDGDSGAAVFVVERATQRALIIGIHRGLDESGAAEATYAEPALARLGAEIVSAPN